MIVSCWQTQPWFPQFVQLVKPGTTGTSQQRDCHLTSSRSSEHYVGSAYNAPVQRWLDFCNRRQLNSQKPTVSQVLDFLHKLYELGLSHSAIETHRNAISAIVEIPGVPQLGEHWLVSPFMKGIFHLRPPQPRYTKTWDVNKVLSYLKSLGPNDSLTLKQLTLKTEALLIILGRRRFTRLYMLSAIHMDQSPDKVIFHIIGLRKCSKPT